MKLPKIFMPVAFALSLTGLLGCDQEDKNAIKQQLKEVKQMVSGSEPVQQYNPEIALLNAKTEARMEMADQHARNISGVNISQVSEVFETCRTEAEENLKDAKSENVIKFIVEQHRTCVGTQISQHRAHNRIFN